MLNYQRVIDLIVSGLSSNYMGLGFHSKRFFFTARCLLPWSMLPGFVDPTRPAEGADGWVACDLSDWLWQLMNWVSINQLPGWFDGFMSSNLASYLDAVGAFEIKFEIKEDRLFWNCFFLGDPMMDWNHWLWGGPLCKTCRLTQSACRPSSLEPQMRKFSGRPSRFGAKSTTF